MYMTKHHDLCYKSGSTFLAVGLSGRSIASLNEVIVTIVLFQTQKLVVLLPDAGAVQIERVLVVGAVDADGCECEKLG